MQRNTEEMTCLSQYPALHYVGSFITRSVNFDHLAIVVSARFLNIVFLSQTDSCLNPRNFGTFPP